MPTPIEPPRSPRSATCLEKFPPEILTLVAQNLGSIRDILSLARTSRQLWSKMMCVASNRDAIARAWISNNAPWYVPTEEEDEEEADEEEGADEEEEEEEIEGKEENEDTSGISLKNFVVSWDYLRRCWESGSMRNRERIWKVAQCIEAKANSIGQ